MKTNFIGPSRRGRGLFQDHLGTRALLRYIAWALLAEPPNSARRRHLLLVRVSSLSRLNGRLRACKACGRPFLGPNRSNGRNGTLFCPACLKAARQTPAALHRKAIHNVRTAKNKLVRIRTAIGDPKPPPLPCHCQHEDCSKPGKPTWLTPGEKPTVLCRRHAWAARQAITLTKPRPRGRPKTGRKPRRKPAPE